MSPQEKARVYRDVRERLRAILPDQTLGALSGNRLAYRVDEANIIKQAIDLNRRAVHEAALRGVQPKPALDSEIANSLRRKIESLAPEVRAMNRRTQRAIVTERDLKRMAKTQRTPEVEALRNLKSEQVARAMAMNPQEQGLIGLHPGLPPGFSVRAPKIPAAADATASALSNPMVREAARYGPRGVALLLQLLQESEGP